ncbi:putative transcription factor interactor and regulator CCHC(Zn) family [Helianthus annuus]|nr:putative transcription factor interactor and regulator CCHC(Zn) family [Helianthus annuus]KAJ0947596.1 putative transcription factor interactor and regulator CCHC(Zn) family [Helianthus annuus]
MSVVSLSTHTHFPIQLTSDNFLSWRKQVLSTLTGLELEQYVDGLTEPPPKELDGKPNPAYRLWFRQDQILLGALLGSCAPTIQPIVSSADTSRELFQRLTESYAGVSRSRIISLRTKLATHTRGTKPIAEFLHEMKAIADELALANKPVDEDDLIVHILAHLGEDYKQIVASVKMRDTPITFPDLFEKLIDHERTLKESQSVPLIATVNNTQRQGPRSYSRPYSEARHTNRPHSSGPRNNRPPYNTNNQQSNSRTNRNNFFCQFCNIPGHDIKDCRKLARLLQENNIAVSSPSAPNTTVNYSMASSSSSPRMYDSGASNHATYDQSSLHNLSEYGGPDEIVLGNGPSHGGATSAGSECK